MEFETILKYHEWYLCQMSRTNVQMFGYLAFLAPAIFNRGESKDLDCNLTNDLELPEIPSMNAIIIQRK